MAASGKSLQAMVAPKSKPRFALCIVAILTSNFVAALDSGLSSSAHVAVASHFDRSNASTWPVNAFLVCSLMAQPLYAGISDQLGRKPVYMTAAILFLLGTVFAATAPSWPFLIMARCLCGFGMAGIVTMGSVVLTDLVGVERRGHYQSINYVNYGSGSAIGSIVGGALVDRLGWSYVYKSQLPLSIVSTAMILVYMPSQHHSAEQVNPGLAAVQDFLERYDTKGSVCLIASLLCLLFVLSTAGNVLPWSHPLILLSWILLVLLLGTLISVERKAKNPILPAAAFRFPLIGVIITGMLYSMINYTVMYNITFFLQTVRLQTAEQASAHLVIPSVAFTVASAATGTLIARLGSPWPTLQASRNLLFLGSVGSVAMVALLPKLGAPDITYDFLLTLSTFGVGMMAPSTLLTLLNLCNTEEHATINGAFIMMRSLGILAATSLSTTIIQNTFQGYVNLHNYSDTVRREIDEARLNVELVRLLPYDVKSEVVGAYQLGFTIVFGLNVLLSLAIYFALARLPATGFQDRYQPIIEESSIELHEDMSEDWD